MSERPNASAVPTYWRVYGRTDRVALVRAETQDEYDAAVAKLRWKPIGRERAKIHQCDACGNLGAWSDDWAWFGSYGDLDDGKPIVKTCSAECRHKAKKMSLVPNNAALLDGSKI